MYKRQLYVGTVKRENIGFDITAMTIEEGETYDKAKQRTVAARVEDFLDGHKTIIYYPFAGGIDMKLKTWVYPANWHWVASYYGKKMCIRDSLCGVEVDRSHRTFLG